MLTSKKISNFKYKNVIRLGRNGLNWFIAKLMVQGRPSKWIKRDNLFIGKNLDKINP